MHNLYSLLHIFLCIFCIYTGKDKLPDVDLVVEKLFKRKEFIPDKVGISLLLSFMAQHFTHQVFKTDFKAGPGYTFGSQMVG